MILPLVERSIAICQDAIKYSDYPEDMIDVVLLVGGASQIPLVQQKVKQAFGDKVVVHPRPMYAVAEGALKRNNKQNCDKLLYFETIVKIYVNLKVGT